MRSPTVFPSGPIGCFCYTGVTMTHVHSNSDVTREPALRELGGDVRRTPRARILRQDHADLGIVVSFDDPAGVQQVEPMTASERAPSPLIVSPEDFLTEAVGRDDVWKILSRLAE